MELYELTITEASKGLQEKKFSSSELTNACLERIKAVEPKLHALVTLTEEQALEQAQKVRTLIVEDFARAFEEVDVVIGPTSPSTALPVGSSKNHPMFGEVSDALLEPSSIAGLLGISICCGFSQELFTIGMQVIGHHFLEVTEWRSRRPDL
jgi:Asp-tRNA(Asn)/Glu-tRNA(Gln) amidotransferase A subunit family amidase